MNTNIYIELHVINKREAIEMPKELVNYSLIRRDYDVPEWARHRVSPNFSKEDLVIFYIDPLKAQSSIDKIFSKIYDVTGITREQIKGKRGKDEVVFSRQLFHYFYMKQFLGSTPECGKETNNDHATVLHSVKSVNNSIETDRSWRREILIKLDLINKETE